MTGEITLRGQVLPVGGIKQKVLAAARVGLDTVILPKRNEPDLEDVPEEIRDKMTFIFAERVDDVFAAALRDVVGTLRNKEQMNKVLIVDDQISAARLLVALLQLEGYEARQAADWCNLVAEVQAYQPDLIILDVHLPDVDGFELLKPNTRTSRSAKCRR